MTTQLLSFGQQITSAADSLQVISLVDVAQQIRSDAHLQASTTRLRKLALLDAEAARTLKTRLPYVVGSVFGTDAPTRRTTDTFVSAGYFILDLDHCTGIDGCVPDSIRADDSVALAFVSPSGAGLKLFFRLSEPCTDARRFALAYRNFATDFGVRHRWTKSVDLRTSDVTRACFLAHDPSVHHNPDAQAIDWRVWLTDTEGFSSAEETDLTPTRKPASERPIDPVAYGQVLKQINPNTTAVRRERQVHVPDELQAMEPLVRTLCQSLNWELRAVESLNYGLKFGIRQGLRSAEVSVYWGKRGFSVVRSPKTGTDPALNDLLHSHLFSLLFPEPVAVQVPLSDVAYLN